MRALRSKLFVVLAILVALMLIVGSAGAAPKDGPEVSLSSAQSEYVESEAVLITVTISNPTRHSVRILKWFTPAEGLEEPVFVVRVDGEAVAYTGAFYKRPPATGNDYLTLKAGQSVAYTIDLGEVYDLAATGEYEIYYNAASEFLYNEKGNAASNPDYLSSEALLLKVEGRQPKRPPTPTPPPPGGTSFASCTVTQQAVLLNARNQAKSYAAGSENYLIGNASATSRYVEWFGAFTSSRYNTARSHFTALSDAWDNAGVTFNCGCKQNYYAYVYPTQPYTIYLCKVFWQAPLAGTDSQGGTLIHEMSHFNVVIGTDDFIYGQVGARNLALTNPDDALMNADNHEYFAENNPFLP